MAEAMPGDMPAPTMEDFAAFEQIRQEVSPSEINETLLSAAAEADPMAVAEFKSELRDLDLPPEVLDALDGMVDEILASPDRYAEIRSHYLTQDMSEELLPEVFDPEFFGALSIALDEIRATSGEPARAPQGFARGGIASLASQGRNGDTMLAHVTPAEMRMLKDRGGSGTINPRTGLPEFFSLKKIFSKIGRAVKKFARSTIGKIVIGTALFMFAGPAAYGALGLGAGTAGAAAVSGFVAGAGSSLLAGESLKDSLKTGAISAITAGAVKGVSNQISGGAEAIEIVESTADYVAPASDAATEALSSTGLETSSLTDRLSLDPFAADLTGAQIPVSPAVGTQPAVGTRIAGDPFAADLTGGQFPVSPAVGTQPAVNSGVGSLNTDPSLAGITRESPFLASQTAAQTAPLTPQPTFGQNVKDIFLNDTLPDSSRFDSFKSAFSPTARKAAGAENALLKTMEQFPEMSREAILTADATSGVGRYLAANTPNMVSNFAPAAAGVMGVMGLAGGFDTPESEMPDGFGDFMNRRGNPDRYALNFGGVRPMGSSGYTTYTPPPYVPPTYNAAQGSGPSGVAQGFPRMNGPIDGPGTGTSDDVPAMLSDGEFVFTAKAVRNMGQGSRRKGAKKMYALMKKLEGTT